MSSKTKPDGTTLGLLGLIVTQTACSAFFLYDAVADIIADGMAAFNDVLLHVEMVATLSMIVAVILEGRFLVRLLRRNAHAERGLSIASGALHDLMEQYFHEWGLTPSEADVATFAIKGLDIAEIAEVRGTAEGTVKTHLNAIYRKSGTSGRGALLGLLVDDLLAQPLIERKEPPKDMPKASGLV